jgi:ribosomal protein S18 acetylase RimI-like enzyme
MIEIRCISIEDPLYPAERELRFRVLRQPLGFEQGAESFDFEDQSVHVVAVEEEQVVGCVLFFPDGKGSGRLFQMAVASHLQGHGLGRDLVRYLESELVKQGVSEVRMHAREQAVGFYERLGYACFGEPFTEIGVPHRNMRRELLQD